MTVYETIASRIITQLELGVVPWRKEWRGGGLPKNLQSGKRYRGINVLSLLCSGYTSSEWLTFRQAKAMGGSVRKGEHGTPVVYWNTHTVTDEATGEDKERGFCRLYYVFNVQQIDGMAVQNPLAFDTRPFSPIAAAESIVAGYLSSKNHPTLEHGGSQAYYQASTDHVQMPLREAFTHEHGYYSTLYHELIHSTGHRSRLDREQNKVAAFGSADYSREELIAEFGASFLCGESGIATDSVIQNSAAYISSWVQRLRSEPNLCVMAAQRAQRAADLILGRSFSSEVGDAAAA